MRELIPPQFDLLIDIAPTLWPFVLYRSVPFQQPKGWHVIALGEAVSVVIGFIKVQKS